MKKLLFVIAILLSFEAVSQDVVYFSKIKLKDGSEFTAQIIENHPGDFIRIKLGEGQFSTFMYAEVESIQDKNFRFRSQFSLSNGFFVEAAYAFMFGKSGELGDPRLGMSLGVTGNYRFNPHLTLGAGFDLNALYVNSNYFLIPIYARLSGSMSEKRVVPYYILDAGWSTASTGDMLEEDFEMNGGLFLRPEIGIRVNRVRIGIGYQIQQIKTSYTNDLWWINDQFVVEERIMRNIRMGVSVLF